MSEKLGPLRDGCVSNRDHWQEVSVERSKNVVDEMDQERCNKDEEEEQNMTSASH